MGWQIVHDDDVAFREGGNQAFFDPFLKQGGVDRPVVNLRGRKAAKAQTGDERDRFVMAVRDGDAQPPSSPAAPPFARQIGGSAGLIDENEFCGIKIELSGKPLLASLQNVRTLLLFCMGGLFLNVIS